MILGDEKRLIQVLSNLVGNTLKFTKSGAISISAQTLTQAEDGQVELKIKDTGCGIPSDILPTLFNKFVTSNGSHGGGTGLGLFIAKSIIEAHGGGIKAENNADGVGAPFTITMPHLKQPNNLPYRDGENSKSERAASA
jgi:signal transduction histidine kinase